MTPFHNAIPPLPLSRYSTTAMLDSVLAAAAESSLVAEASAITALRSLDGPHLQTVAQGVGHCQLSAGWEVPHQSGGGAQWVGGPHFFMHHGGGGTSSCR